MKWSTDDLLNTALDGSLTPDEQREFEQLLSRDPRVRQQWELEQRWLGQLQITPGGSDQVAQVLDRWQEQRHAASTTRWRVAACVGLAAAACLAVLAMLKLQPAADVAPPGLKVGDAQQAPDGLWHGPMQQQAPDNPLSQVMIETADRITQQPGRILQTIEQTRQQLTPDRLLTLITPDLPDPARLFAPAEETPGSTSERKAPQEPFVASARLNIQPGQCNVFVTPCPDNVRT